MIGITGRKIPSASDTKIMSAKHFNTENTRKKHLSSSLSVFHFRLCPFGWLSIIFRPSRAKQECNCRLCQCLLVRCSKALFPTLNVEGAVKIGICFHEIKTYAYTCPSDSKWNHCILYGSAAWPQETVTRAGTTLSVSFGRSSYFKLHLGLAEGQVFWPHISSIKFGGELLLRPGVCFWNKHHLLCVRYKVSESSC